MLGTDQRGLFPQVQEGGPWLRRVVVAFFAVFRT